MTSNNNFLAIENDELSLVNAGGLGETICTTAGGGAGAFWGAKWGAKIGWLGGPAGAVLGGAVGAGVGYVVYNAFM